MLDGDEEMEREERMGKSEETQDVWKEAAEWNSVIFW